jgi:hypothetical protein
MVGIGHQQSIACTDALSDRSAHPTHADDDGDVLRH